MEQQDSNQCNSSSSSRARIEPGSKPTAHSLQLHYCCPFFHPTLFMCISFTTHSAAAAAGLHTAQEGTSHLYYYSSVTRGSPSNYCKGENKGFLPCPGTDCGQNYLSDSKVYSKTHFTSVCFLQMS